MTMCFWFSCLLLVSIAHHRAYAQLRIVGGDDAELTRYPYHTSLYRNSIQTSDFICGGTLVAPDVILSAAHCGNDGASINFVMVNNTSIAGDNPYGYPRQVVEIIVHPGWNPSTLRNDLMLLILDEAVVDVEPIPYSRHFPVLSTLDSLNIVGLGRLEDGGSFPSTLQEVQVDLTAFDDCANAYSSNGMLNTFTGLTKSSQFCASAPGRDSCQGDSGGPLVVSSLWAVADVQIGLVSFGQGCAQPDYPGMFLYYVLLSALENVHHISRLCCPKPHPGVYTRLDAFADWLDQNICGVSKSAPSFCSSSKAPPISGVGRNVRISSSRLVVSTQSYRGLETTVYGEITSTWSLPTGVESFDDVSIEGSFIFALDVTGRTICTYIILDSNDIALQSCYEGNSWNVGTFGGISCREGVCVIAQGEDGMTILDYDTASGAIAGSPRVINLSFDNVDGFYDVEVISASMAAMSTHFRNGINTFRPRYGTMVVDLNTYQSPDDGFRIRQNALRSSLAVEPTNFALVNAFYHSSGRTFMYTAHGGMTVQDVGESGSTQVVEDTALGGKFRAVTVAVDNGIAAFGGLVEDDTGRNYVLLFDLIQDPMKPVRFGLFQIPDRILSIAIRDNLVAVVGTQDVVVQLLNLTEATIPGSDGAVSSSGGEIAYIPSPWSPESNPNVGDVGAVNTVDYPTSSGRTVKRAVGITLALLVYFYV